MTTWLIEPMVFDKVYKDFEMAIKAAGHNIIYWKDDYTNPDNIPLSLRFIDEPVIFHGSLGTAYHISRRWLLSPGTFGSLKPFECTSYYPKTLTWRLNKEYVVSTVGDICTNSSCLKDIGNPEAVFIRPSSPLKQFSGRVLNVNGLTPQSMDHGFYYDNLNLTIVIAPAKKVYREWRFVVVDRKVVAGNGYLANSRTSCNEKIATNVWEYASEIAANIGIISGPPSIVYVLDICDSDEGLKLLELNPFSGADLYGCNYSAIVEAVGDVATKLFK